MATHSEDLTRAAPGTGDYARARKSFSLAAEYTDSAETARQWQQFIANEEARMNTLVAP